MIPNTLPQSLVDNPWLSRWVGFTAGGRVRIATGKVEIGQGVTTALVQIAAEELDIDPARFDVVSGASDRSPAEGVTAGSASVEMSGGALRLACAEVRALALDAAAERLGVAPSALTITDGRVMREGVATGLDYWTLALDLDRPATGTAPAKRRAAYRIVGTDLPRIDLPAKVTAAPFIHDLAPDGLVHARVLHRPWRDARLAAIDEARIARAARVPVEIVREGDFLAVLADDETAAMRAITAARETAVWSGGSPLPEGFATPGWLAAQPAHVRTLENGTPTAAEGLVHEATYWRPCQTHASIGPSCALAREADGLLVVTSHTQGPTLLRDWIARVLGRPTESVVVRHHQAAGCYGHNTADDVAFEAAFLAERRPGPTVRVMFTREEEFLAGPLGPPMLVRLRAVLGPDHRPTDWTIDVTSPVHTARPGVNGHHHFASAEALPGAAPRPAEQQDAPDAGGGGATRNALALYDLPNQRVVHRRVDPFPARTSALRGLGTLANVFAIESFVDELAEIAGEDPLAYRLSLLSDRRARAVLETAAAMARWTPEPAGTGRGRGLAVSRYKNRAGYMGVVAEVEVEEHVRVTRIWGAADAGLVISPDGALNQLEGGVVQAVSFALREELRFADGRVATATFEDYPILRFSETPEITLRLIGSADDPPLGLGEVATGPTVAAVANAVAHALGTRIRALPFSRERLTAALLAT